VLLVLDKLEEQRSLNIPESNFRTILKEYINKLLRCARWVRLRDEPTKFFHGIDTEKYRINTIESLQDEEGREVT
jgi:hypothetical protein